MSTTPATPAERFAAMAVELSDMAKRTRQIVQEAEGPHSSSKAVSELQVLARELEAKAGAAFVRQFKLRAGQPPLDGASR